jgi:hypothetical protein
MTKVLIIGEVEDSTKWEAGFRTHVDLFRKQTISKPIEFAINENNKVGVCFQPDDIDTYLTSMNSPETAEAMAFDGVKRDTVQIFVLDKELQI